MKVPRLIRGPPPEKIRKSDKFFRGDALPSLLRDFKCRCAYCLSHSQFIGGDEAFKIDHFHPTSKGGSKTAYENLFLACDRCNHYKWDEWPQKLLQDIGIRFLNCFAETDYGDQIIENEKGELLPVTKAADYHIETINLNRKHLVTERLKRRKLCIELRRYLDRAGGHSAAEPINDLLEKVTELKSLLENMIPSIPAHPISPAVDHPS